MKTAVQDPWKRFREKWKTRKGEIRGQKSQSVDTERNTGKDIGKDTEQEARET